MTMMIERHQHATMIVRGATADTVEYMQSTGWHRCSKTLNEDEAILVVEGKLNDPHYVVLVTKTCAGYIVWNAQREKRNDRDRLSQLEELLMLAPASVSVEIGLPHGWSDLRAALDQLKDLNIS